MKSSQLLNEPLHQALVAFPTRWYSKRTKRQAEARFGHLEVSVGSVLSVQGAHLVKLRGLALDKKQAGNGRAALLPFRVTSGESGTLERKHPMTLGSCGGVSIASSAIGTYHQRGYGES